VSNLYKINQQVNGMAANLLTRSLLRSTTLSAASRKEGIIIFSSNSLALFPL
jgi:hypothetical protein